MKTIVKILSLIGLVLTLLPAILYFYDYISADLHKQLMLCGTLIWFVSAPLWMNKSQEAS
ncbi:hypothetical protein PZB74_09355 [Porifericola rhodea]|uniref:hypothetical protein n=1 Tax=Porifericola rhodea TaxID=930972 RepID=UPI00266688A8|nr:hypothetical protein [Porifericola rhodea]WKN33536.1 hypothetical protein PZB74_09355 [Porifericola rhodea]